MGHRRRQMRPVKRGAVTEGPHAAQLSRARGEGDGRGGPPLSGTSFYAGAARGGERAAVRVAWAMPSCTSREQHAGHERTWAWYWTEILRGPQIAAAQKAYATSCKAKDILCHME
ncbi:hypothetical protein FH972_021537 [Carpinus fangiana]|uniref:Uncharacterized protein n=1 Tax=Carpinus fangiana TaxID=176857 RepID=A0A5N6KQ79_9ROSI|nr:hypothetical protein FH972_021537 [Carpinus fangiana]